MCRFTFSMSSGVISTSPAWEPVALAPPPGVFAPLPPSWLPTPVAIIACTICINCEASTAGEFPPKPEPPPPPPNGDPVPTPPAFRLAPRLSRSHARSCSACLYVAAASALVPVLESTSAKSAKPIGRFADRDGRCQ